ncbi:MAG: zf-HC2 domain-containing protein [Actinomycetota bacterium]|nr:zf-HC2 domain-containing protein [Actinomycetota bacterium]
MTGQPEHRCDPELIFELADGALGLEQEREVRAHLGCCPGCLTLYESEHDLNAWLGSLEFEEPRSVCRAVVMALPTRSVKVRLLWAGLAVALLVVASVALSLDGTNPAVFAVDALVTFWSFVSGSADVVRVLLAAVGPALLAALAVGALLDLIIAAVYLSVSRRRAREA